MITRKAAIGFILLAIITFSISSYDAANSFYTPETNPELAESAFESAHFTDNSRPDLHASYRPPLLNFGDYNPIIITALMELVALCLYLIAKRVEPTVVAWEKAERERVAAEWDDLQDSNPQDSNPQDEPE